MLYQLSYDHQISIVGSWALPTVTVFGLRLRCYDHQIYFKLNDIEMRSISPSFNHFVRTKGIEPLTHSLEGCCSIQLSYVRLLRP